MATDDVLQTSVPGVFAAGDVRADSLLVKLGAADSDESMAEAGQMLAGLAHYFATDGRANLPPYSAAIVEVTGIQNGRERTARYTCLDHMDRLTGVPAAVAAVMIAEGRVTGTGVLPPEAAFDPEQFLSALADEGITVSAQTGSSARRAAA